MYVFINIAYRPILYRIRKITSLRKQGCRMLKKITKYIKFRKFINEQQNNVKNDMTYFENDIVLSKRIDENVAMLKGYLGKSDDVIFREFYFGVNKKSKALITFVDGLGDKNLIIEDVLKSLTVDIHITDPEGQISKNNLFENIKDHILNIIEAKDVININEVIEAVLSGDSILLIDGSTTGIAVSSKGGEKRGVTEPQTEVVVRGSREAFVETIRINTSMLRRIIKNPNLVFETLVVGKQTHTDICIAYIDSIVNMKIVEEVKRRINRIDIDAILESGYIEQLIDDNPFSPFSTIGNSERPDKVAGKLLEGHVAIFCNGTPIVLTVPYTFTEAIQVPEDYYSRPLLTNVIRLLRILSLFLTLLLPAVYIALTTFHQEMLPTVLVITFAAAREGIPFPVIVETLLAEIIFQLIRESGIRMPRAVGGAVNIVGTLVIGEAAVNAGIIGAPMVIITALSGITSFILPAIYDGIFIFKIILILLSSAFGIYGILVGMLCMLAHMCSLRSFGTSYMSPFAPVIWSDMKDSVLRVPLWFMKTRPKGVMWRDSKRNTKNSTPTKPSKNGGDKNK